MGGLSFSSLPKILLAACAAAACSAAVAATATKWDHIADSKDGLVSFYGGGPIVSVRGAVRRARLLYDYREPQLDPDTMIANRSTIAVMLVDCTRRALASIEGTDYAGAMGNGKIVSRSRQLPDALPVYAAAKAGTPDDEVVNYVCKASR